MEWKAERDAGGRERGLDIVEMFGQSGLRDEPPKHLPRPSPPLLSTSRQRKSSWESASISGRHSTIGFI